MKFGDLKQGEKFISIPDDDDEPRPYWIFIKIEQVGIEYCDVGNAIRLKDGNLSHMPDIMEVVKVE